MDGQGTVKKKIVKEYSPVKVTEAHKKDFIKTSKMRGPRRSGDIALSRFSLGLPPIIFLKTDETKGVCEDI